MTKYVYGMLHARGAGPGCQPRHGFLGVEHDYNGSEYSNVIVYNRKLTEAECYQYELEFIREEAEDEEK